MTSQALAVSLSNDIAFSRLRTLVSRGYRPTFDCTGPGAFFVSLSHPRASKRRYMPRLALWNDGILATDGVLWPEHYVPTDPPEPPAWQKFILADDGATFERFVSSVDLPSPIDVYARPAWRALCDFAIRFVIGVSLCAVGAGCVRLAVLALGS